MEPGYPGPSRLPAGTELGLAASVPRKSQVKCDSGTAPDGACSLTWTWGASRTGLGTQARGKEASPGLAAGGLGWLAGRGGSSASWAGIEEGGSSVGNPDSLALAFSSLEKKKRKRFCQDLRQRCCSLGSVTWNSVNCLPLDARVSFKSGIILHLQVHLAFLTENKNYQ